MLNQIEDAKQLIGIDPEAIGLSDDVKLSNDVTPFEQYLQSASLITKRQIQFWGGDVDHPGANELAAEILLLRAQIVIDHEVVSLTDFDEIQSGGSGGMRLRSKRITREERGEIVADLHTRAMNLVTGEDPADFAGVL